MPMAANLQQSIRGPLRTLFANRIFRPIRSASSSFSLCLTRRGLQTSVYDRNLDDPFQPSVVPDEVSQPQSDKYWAPDPQTGVFGPASEHNSGGERFFHLSANTNASEDSALEQKAFFRALEIVD